jgi:protein-S-isoprenylcysteine O-methyltransferase Ste14
MTLGTILAYLGLSIAAATIVGVILVAALAALLLLYIKRMEEKELAERFGEEYLAYKRDVPFIIPRMPRRG